MTYSFFLRFFSPRAAAWMTAVWLSGLFMVMVMLASFDEPVFIYLDF